MVAYRRRGVVSALDTSYSIFPDGRTIGRSRTWPYRPRSLLPSDVSVSTHLPQWFVETAFSADDESPIYLFDLAETVLPACLAAYRSGGNHRTCVLRIDNKAAIDALVKGSSSAALCTILVNLFWSVAARFPAVRRFGYVNTKSNAAGPPSRLFDAPLGSVCSRSYGEIPPELSRISPPWRTPRRDPTLSNK